MYPSEKDKEHFFHLLTKYSAQTATAEEVEFVERYLDVLNYRSADVPGGHENEKEAVGSEIQARLFKSIHKEDIQPVVHRIHLLRRGWQQWAAAAVIAVMIAGAYFFLRSNRTPQQAVAYTKAQNDVNPGKQGAVLTLSDGSQLVLDSLQNGVVATQGGTLVQLTGNQLLYSNNGKTKSAEASYNTVSTPRGRQYKLMLPDGTNVWLNAASSLTFPTAFHGKDRVVSVTGEAYFEVAKNKQLPFKVKLRTAAEIEVLGTEFNVNAYSDEPGIKTTLTQGSVKVVSGAKAQMLTPGQQAQVFDRLTPIKLVTNANLNEVLAWKDGIFSFTNADLPTVMRALARWYDIEVQYKGVVPKAEFTGEIDKSLSLSQVLKGLSKTRINYKIENGNTLTILP